MRKLLFLLISVLTLSGCGLQPRIVDDISLATLSGYDYINKNEIRSIVSRPQYYPDKSIQNKIYEAVGPLIRENFTKLDAKASRPIFNGKLAVVLFNRKLAKQGLLRYIDNLVRDPDVGSRVYLVVTKNDVGEIINQNYDYEGQDAGIYLSNLIAQNQQNSILPKTNLHTFYYQYYAKGIDPYLPLMALDGKQVGIDGVALFKSDKYVGTIPFDQTFAFNLLVQRYNNGNYAIHRGNKSSVIENVKSVRKIRVRYQDGLPRATITLKVTGIVREFRGKSVTPGKMDELNKEFANSLTQEEQKITRRLQKLSTDPIGLGEKARSQNRGFSFKKWEEDYPEMPIKVVVDSHLTEFGTEK